MMRKPLISVLLPYRKKDAYFLSALQSLKNQTYDRMEILSEEDSENVGIAVLLNRLAGRAAGEFLARMDADDVSEPDRIEKQVDFLIAHPRVMLVGTWASLIDESGRKMRIQKMPTSWEEIKQQAFFRNPLIHPTWMMRRKWFENIGGYNAQYRFSQDWELILRRVWHDRIENIPEPLLRLRLHKGSSSFSANKQQLYYGIKAQMKSVSSGNVPAWKAVYLFPKIFSFIVPTFIKYIFRNLWIY